MQAMMNVKQRDCEMPGARKDTVWDLVPSSISLSGAVLGVEASSQPSLEPGTIETRLFINGEAVLGSSHFAC
jgi:hypothetical protein